MRIHGIYSGKALLLLVSWRRWKSAAWSCRDLLGTLPDYGIGGIGERNVRLAVAELAEDGSVERLGNAKLVVTPKGQREAEEVRASLKRLTGGHSGRKRAQVIHE